LTLAGSCGCVEAHSASNLGVRLTDTHTHVHTRTCTHTCTYTRTHTYRHTRTHVHTRACIHTRTHTHTHAGTHTRTSSYPQVLSVEHVRPQYALACLLACVHAAGAVAAPPAPGRAALRGLQPRRCHAGHRRKGQCAVVPVAESGRHGTATGPSECGWVE